MTELLEEQFCSYADASTFPRLLGRRDFGYRSFWEAYPGVGNPSSQEHLETFLAPLRGQE